MPNISIKELYPISIIIIALGLKPLILPWKGYFLITFNSVL